MPEQPKGLNLRALAPYEDRLLSALSFFRTKRQKTTQAHHCLSMYLRQSESRILGELEFYARMTGLDKYQLLELIYSDPDRAQELIDDATGVSVADTFEQDSHNIEAD